MNRFLKITALGLGAVIFLLICSSLYQWVSPFPLLTKGLPIVQRWSVKFNDAAHEISATDDETMILVRTNRAIYSLLANTGEIVWNFDLEPQVELSPALTADGRVFITDSKSIWSLSQEDGRILWSQSLPETRGWVVSANSQVVVVNQRSNDIRAYNAVTGQFLWRIYTSGGAVQAYVDQDEVYILDYGLKGIDLLTGEVLWEVKGNVIGWSSYEDGKIYYTSGDHIFAYDARNQIEIWKANLASTGFRKFKISKDYVLVTDADYLYAFNKTTGELHWKVRLSYPANPTLIKDNIYVREGFKQVIQVFRINTGEKIGSIQVSLPQLFFVEHQNVTSVGGLLIFSSEKVLYAYQEKITNSSAPLCWAVVFAEYPCCAPSTAGVMCRRRWVPPPALPTCPSRTGPRPSSNSLQPRASRAAAEAATIARMRSSPASRWPSCSCGRNTAAPLFRPSTAATVTMILRALA
jgi:outer membrane protein assembly factor BamB